MHTIAFRSADPLDHVCRALDTVRKMGFQLASLRVEGDPEDGFRISISVGDRDTLIVGTLLARLSSCIGVRDVTCEAEDRVGST